MTRKQRIAAAFSRAAPAYETAAPAQSQTAEALAARVLGLTLPPFPRVLEVGCGTGFLTRRLLPHLDGRWTITDIAPDMVAVARRNMPEADAEFRIMDGERPDVVPGGVDLLISNLAAQWFLDLPGALSRLINCLAPGGTLMLTTLGMGTFAEWRMAHNSLGLSCGVPSYPSPKMLASMLPKEARVDSRMVRVPYANALAFVRSLHAIGAGIPAENHRPLPSGALKRVLAAMAQPCIITYEILTVEYRR